MDDLWSDFQALDEEFLSSDELKKSVGDEHDLLLSEQFSSISAEYSCITRNPDEEETSTARRVGRGKCMKKLLSWKERCDAEEAAKESTARGQERPGKSLKLLLEKHPLTDTDSQEIGDSICEVKKYRIETNLKPARMKTTAKQRIEKVLKNNKAKNTKTRRLFKFH